jgi:OmcA/MtrC family decaheme c-type cytochrome
VAPVGTTRIQATLESDEDDGTLTDLGLTGAGTPGEYEYVFAADLSAITTGNGEVLDVPYESDQTHRIGIETPRGGPSNSAHVDFVPDALPALGTGTTRDIAVSASCNECHVNLALHGDHRVGVAYCVTCHNPGSADPHSRNTVDFKVMIHKIHDGENLPSIEAGGQYAIWGFFNSKHDYSHVVYPQDVRNCTKCHDGGDADTPDGDNWKTMPTMEACGSCHDDVNFASGANHDGGAQADNDDCDDCHEPDDIVEHHGIPEQAAAEMFEYNIIDISNTDPGEFPVVTFSVTDPTSGDAPYDMLNDPEFTAPAGASRLAILIGWVTKDYNNTGSGSTPAQPISIDALTDAVDNMDGTFTVTSEVPIPEDITGSSGVVGIEGHPAVESDPGSGEFDLRVPVQSVVESFAITDPSPEDRRTVVDVDNCNQCHGYLSLHGANRNNEIQICVICHNANATDINRRPADPTTTADGKVEEAIDFKHMIHAIHAAQFREEGIVVFGFGNVEHDFSHVVLPNPSGPGTENLNLRNCEGCHVNGNGSTFELPLDPNVQTTTISTGDDPADPNDDTDITPIASVCSSCHDSTVAKTHMAENGGEFEFLLFAPDTSDTDGQTQADLCGPGPISAQPGGHTSRTDCCSCHAIQ